MSGIASARFPIFIRQPPWDGWTPISKKSAKPQSGYVWAMASVSEVIETEQLSLDRLRVDWLADLCGLGSRHGTHPICSRDVRACRGTDNQKPVHTGQTVYQYSQPAVGGSDRHLNQAIDRPVR